MPPIARLNDPCTHPCYSNHVIQAGSGNVFANGKPVARLGDPISVHCCGPACHGSTLASGSGKVFVNGKPAERLQDPAQCGSKVAGGSGNVVAN